MQALSHSRAGAVGAWSLPNAGRALCPARLAALRISGARAAPLGTAPRPAAPAAARASAAAAAPRAPTAQTETPMEIVFISAEVAPWSKTGGLGDVVGALPVELARRGHAVYSIAPRYDQYWDAWDTAVSVEVEGETVRVGVVVVVFESRAP
jgi:granule-bound starch synthase